MKFEAGSFRVPWRRFLSLSHTYKPPPSINGTPGVSRRMTRSENSPRLVPSTALPSDRPVIQFLQTGTHSPMCLSGCVRVARAGYSVSRFPLGNQPNIGYQLRCLLACFAFGNTVVTSSEPPTCVPGNIASATTRSCASTILCIPAHGCRTTAEYESRSQQPTASTVSKQTFDGSKAISHIIHHIQPSA